MIKEWYVLINLSQEGPYSIDDLLDDKRINSDTYVWKEGFRHWKKIRDVDELKELFEKTKQQETKETVKKIRGEELDDEVVIDIQQEPPYLFWLIIAVLLVSYLVIHFIFFST